MDTKMQLIKELPKYRIQNNYRKMTIVNSKNI